MAFELRTVSAEYCVRLKTLLFEKAYYYKCKDVSALIFYYRILSITIG